MRFRIPSRRQATMAVASLALVGSLGAVSPASAAEPDFAFLNPTVPIDPFSFALPFLPADFTTQIQLAQAYAATARYFYEPFAIADGYIREDFCVASPAGAMGFHYVNPQRLGQMDPSRPDALLYAPGPGGVRQLVGIEFFKNDADQNLATTGDRPTLFNQPFDGPMPGHFPGQPVHYDLHVWLWYHNPAGMFAAFNPALSC